MVLRPLLRSRDSSASGSQADTSELAVYRDQLSEIEKELERGLIDGATAESARAEVGRRIIGRQETLYVSEPVNVGGSGDAPGSSEDVSGLVRHDYLAVSVAVLVGLSSAVLYAVVGSPLIPDRPFAAVAAKDPQVSGVEELVAKVEARLRDFPQEGEGWDVVAPVYLRLRRFDDAVVAYRKAILLVGETPKRLSGFADSLIGASGGVITEVAQEAYARLLAVEPGNLNALVWLARAKEQDGDTAGAIEGYRALLKSAPKDAPWRGQVEAVIAKLSGTSSDAGNGNAGGGDRAAQIRNMSEGEQAKAISKMVSKLAARLKDDGSDFEGWLKLVRSYAVLGRKDEAQGALAEARKLFSSDMAKVVELDGVASQLGIGP